MILYRVFAYSFNCYHKVTPKTVLDLWMTYMMSNIVSDSLTQIILSKSPQFFPQLKSMIKT